MKVKAHRPPEDTARMLADATGFDVWPMRPDRRVAVGTEHFVYGNLSRRGQTRLVFNKGFATRDDAAAAVARLMVEAVDARISFSIQERTKWEYVETAR